MVSKLIFANVLAVIMMTFEQHAPAEVKEKPHGSLGDRVSQSASPALKVSEIKQEAQPVNASQQEGAKAPAAVKKPIYKTNRVAKAPHPHVIKAKSAAVDCCFRGYRS